MAGRSPTNQHMNRGTEAMRVHLSSSLTTMDIRQTRRGWLQELLCDCEARTEFKYFVGENQIAHSLEESSCMARWCCQPCYSYTMSVKELNTEAELLTIERPWRCCAGACKCCECCLQTARITSGGQLMGEVTETCYYCIPMFKVKDVSGQHKYTIHPPTCCGGCCMNCCTEGNPCTRKGCCKVPFWIFEAGKEANGSDAPKIGKILKKPKSAMVEIFTDANAFEVEFPPDATPEDKAVFVGTSVFFNSIFFEGGDD